MEDIIIKKGESEHNGWFVEQGDKVSCECGWDEMMGLVAELTMPNDRRCLQWMKPKVDEYIPKNGDFVYAEGYHNHIFIFSDKINDMINAYAELFEERKVNLNEDVGLIENLETIRPATEEEKNLLLSKLHDLGKDWNAEKKEIVDYVPPYEPKDGDFIYIQSAYPHITIFKNISSESIMAYADLCIPTIFKSTRDPQACGNPFAICDIHDVREIRKATDEEKSEFLSVMNQKGLDWNVEKKEVVDLKWEPKKGDTFYTPTLDFRFKFISYECTFEGFTTQKDKVKSGYVFRTEAECRAMCEKLNEAIKNVK